MISQGIASVSETAQGCNTLARHLHPYFPIEVNTFIEKGVMIMIRTILRSTPILVGISLLASCAQPLSTREKATLVGGGVGAATGAIIGAAVGNPVAGAAIGGTLGGVGGGFVGDQLQQREQVAEGQQQTLDQQRQELARNRELLEELQRQDLEARETERGVVVNLPDVLFAFARADLTPSAQRKVHDIAGVLNDRARDRRVSIEGHTDSVGNDTFNQQLSERRAESVTIALVDSGVSRKRITTQGFGERYPVAPNANPDGTDDPTGRAKNRRVEVVIQN
jgi:outer membrane protein OmpA-like peptidoglycan-associated protein